MPKRSDRKEMLLELDNMLRVLAIYDDDNTEEFQEVLKMYAQLYSTRFFIEREVIPKSSSMIDIMWHYADKEFKQIARMNKSTFIGLLNLIENHAVFKNKSKNKQKPTWIQLLVVLNRLGCEGNGISIDRNAMFNGISHGSVYSYQTRVFAAIKDLEKVYLFWPNIEQRKKISERFGSHHGLPGCVGIVDGTPVNFFQKPGIDGEVYWNRKSRYAINLQLICDDRRNIIFMQTGWPGSVFDSTVFDQSNICLSPDMFFSADEYIIADAGYAAKPFICTPFKQPLAEVPENKLFNHLFSSARCIIEHVNGILKGRFQSLKSIRVLILKVNDLKLVNDWILVCCILHNIMNALNDDWDEEEKEDNDPIEEELRELVKENRCVDNLRVRVQNILLTWYYSMNRL